MPPSWTIRSLLTWMTQDFGALGLDTPRLDAELLIAHVLEIDRVRLYMDLDRPLTAPELAQIRALVVRRRQREPVAYLTGVREFYRRAFAVSPAVLIPRPDTETLIERALELLPRDAARRVLDLCTGSGAIAVTLAAERPMLAVTATDISPDALAIARANAARHGATIDFRRGDLFDALPSGVRYDLVVANPPYVRAQDIPKLAPELGHEPHLALSGGEDGFVILDRLCAGVSARLEPGGALLFEIGADQAEHVIAALGRHDLREARAHRDLGAIERVIEAHTNIGE